MYSKAVAIISNIHTIYHYIPDTVIVATSLMEPVSLHLSVVPLSDGSTSAEVAVELSSIVAEEKPDTVRLNMPSTTEVNVPTLKSWLSASFTVHNSAPVVDLQLNTSASPGQASTASLGSSVTVGAGRVK